LRPAQTNSGRDPILKKAHQKKKASEVAQGIGPEFKPQFTKEKSFSLPLKGSWLTPIFKRQTNKKKA
jgi:hypothetical protein